MNHPILRFLAGRLLLLALLAMVAVLLPRVPREGRLAEEGLARASSPLVSVEHESAAPREAMSGMRAYVDPNTGRLTAPPVGERISGVLEGEPRPVLFPEAAPRGGVRVDLQGSYMVSTRVTLDEEGGATFHCDDPPGAAAELDEGREP